MKPSLFAAMAIVAVCGTIEVAAASDLALIGCKVYPSPTESAISNATVLVRGHRIVELGPRGQVRVPEDAEKIECGDGVVTAGFWNSHVHILTQGLMDAENVPAQRITAQLEEMLTRWGFTTVFDVASVLHNTEVIRQRIARGEVAGPGILTVGDPFYPEGGTPVYIRGFIERNHVPSEEVSDPHQAADRARRQLRAGADGVKIFAASFAGGGRIVPMPLEIARAVVAEAHRAGKPAFAHPSNLEGIEVALGSGVDVLAHTAPLSGPWPASLIARVKAGHMALTPTLTLFEVEARKFGELPDEARQEMEIALGQLHAYSAAGGEVLFGTDVGYTDHYDTAEEFRLMSRAGLSFRQILASLTTNPAHRFGDRDGRGRVAVGHEADLVVLAGDPDADVTSFSRVRCTIRGGNVIYRSH